MANSQSVPRRLVYPLLGLLLLIGFTLRVWNVNFDRGVGSHPDERSTACFYATTIEWPASWEEFRDPHASPLNPLWDRNSGTPRSFTYGHFPLYLGVAAGHTLHTLAPTAQALGAGPEVVSLMSRADGACDAIAVAGRLVIALLDTLTILLLYALAATIYGRGIGLLTAAFYTFTAQAIQLSHFFAMDPAGTTFTVLAVLGGVRMAQRASWRAALMTGVGAGLAISSKFSALPVLAVPVIAAFAVYWRTEQEQALMPGSTPTGMGQARFRAVAGALLAIVIAAVAFVVTSPYAVLDWQQFINATLIEQGRMVRGVADMPFTRQYRNTTPYLYFIRQQVQWGLGWPLGLLALAGTIFALAGLVRTLYSILVAWISGKVAGHLVSQRQLMLLPVWSWVIPYFGLTGAFLAKFNRYMSPLLPFALLFAGGLIWHIVRIGRDRQAARRSVNLASFTAAAIAFIALAGGIFWSVAYVNGVYNREHTWIQAGRWIFDNVPPGSVMLAETWDDEPIYYLPDAPEINRESRGLTVIKWSPYEEDTFDKYELLKETLRASDYVYYSSKRIYDSVDELPERYPLTNLYYQSMFDGRLGFEPAAEFTSPPTLFGRAFDDRRADESWSLYDHPQVHIFRKVRELSNAEYDAIFAGSWEDAVPYYRGQDSPLSPLLNALGLGSDPGTEDAGLINRIIGLITGDDAPTQRAPDAPSLMLETPPGALPVVDNYRWNQAAGEQPGLAVIVWWAVITLLGWIGWPLLFGPLRSLRDRGYFFSRTLGWLLAGWLLWWGASLGWIYNTVTGAWLALALVALAGAAAAWFQRKAMVAYLREQWPALLAGEILFAAAYLFFVLIRIANPDIWQPWLGGEKFMEFAFLNGILRSPTFPPVDPHFAGGFINYYYFGIYLVAYLIKLTGIYAEVAFNLAIPMLFALTVLNAFGLTYSAFPRTARMGADEAGADADGFSRPHWQAGLPEALLGPLFVVIMGNLDGFAQLARSLARVSPWHEESAYPGVATLINAAGGIGPVISGAQALPAYDFWAPSRVIPYTINEFPFWSFLFADLHPHLIGIPFALFFLALVLALIRDGGVYASLRMALPLLLLFTFMLGTLASVNLWELPTYALLGIGALLVSQYRHRGGIRWVWTLPALLIYLAGVFLAYRPFFHNFVSIGASGVGLVREPDPLGQWLLIWGFLLFLVISWLAYSAARPARPRGLIKPGGLERTLSLVWRRFDRLPRFVYLHRLLVRRSTFGYQAGIWLIPLTLILTLAALFLDQWVLALCLPWLALGGLLLWRRGRAADSGAQFAVLLTTLGFGILAGTQIVFLKDFLQGGEYYRMNTLFKFFMQAWVVWAIAGAIAVPRISAFLFARTQSRPTWGNALTEGGWRVAFLLLLMASLAFPLFGSPARLDQRFPGWRPPVGTLSGLAYMDQGEYSLPDSNHVINLHGDYAALNWLLENVRGNPVIVESSQTDYYRAMGTRIASQSGLSGLSGFHEGEQRYAEDVSRRSGLHYEFWQTSDTGRIQAIIDELNIGLIYVGPLEQYYHPDGAARLAQMADQGYLTVLYAQDGVTIYAVTGALEQQAEGYYTPS
ncbi:MAG: glycosyltransferase family 39 protein [Caldilineaceae bacterium]|nr:glycosyltransferase family 39 protein [Caldilineaceae bacterium]